MTVTTFRAETQELLRDRLLDAALALMERRGWSKVTMAAVADEVGVSRQTVYNEVGAKRALAEHLAMRELARFLDLVRVRMTERDDLVHAVQWACEGVLDLAGSNMLVRAIVGSVPGDHPPDLLAILTVDSGEIVEAACTVVKQCVLDKGQVLPLSDAELDIAVESVVRLVLSAITRPSKPAPEAAADIAWILRLALRGASA
ncbi:MAG: TetR family transcriptional regulator [Aeromicrobium sp.]|uniref:TetR family transcriptional regulator n=1 Tax=Aeromicrobium sp. TaxID=1871063 RepID=UPI0039E4473D